MHCQNATYDVFVDLDTEGQRDLLGNSRAAPTGITPFHFNDGIDEFFGRSFRTSPRGWELVSDRDSESTVDVAPAQIQQ